MKRPMVKVCGMTRMFDALLCASLGADMLGFIFHEPSPRNVDPKFARSVPKGGPLKVGVFVRQTPEQIVAIMEECRLDLAQLHGEYDVDACNMIGKGRVMKAMWPERYESAVALKADMDRFSPHCAHLLLDAGKSGGGHGESIEFDSLQDIEITKSWFLAGNIGPHNAVAACELNPAGLDVNSAVERSPGIKDETKLRALFALFED